jgi:hypothetical protein
MEDPLQTPTCHLVHNRRDIERLLAIYAIRTVLGFHMGLSRRSACFRRNGHGRLLPGHFTRIPRGTVLLQSDTHLGFTHVQCRTRYSSMVPDFLGNVRHRILFALGGPRWAISLHSTMVMVGGSRWCSGSWHRYHALADIVSCTCRCGAIRFADSWCCD